MNKKTVFITKAAVIGGIYTVMTLLAAAFGLAYGGVQLRFSEALTVLPLFSSAAVPGLTVGCMIANIFSSVTPLDTVIGSLATLFAAMLTRKTRHITFKGFPLLSMCFPVIFNALFIGVQIGFVSGKDAFLTVFLTNALTVGLGEALVVFTLGTLLIKFADKNERLKKILG